MDCFAGDFDDDQPGFGMIGGHSALHSQRQARRCEEPQEIGRLIDNSHQSKSVSRAAGSERMIGWAGKRTVGPRNRVAVRVDLGMPEIGVDSIDEQIAYSMFHVLGLAVHLIPAKNALLNTGAPGISRS